MNSELINQKKLEKKLSWFKKLAEKMLPNVKKLEDLLEKAEKKMGKWSNILANEIHDLRILIRMIRCWMDESYTEVPRKTIVAGVAALLYLVSPFDLIPDFIPGIGYIDDVAVILLVLRAARQDINRFVEWEKKNHIIIDVPFDVE